MKKVLRRRNLLFLIPLAFGLQACSGSGFFESKLTKNSAIAEPSLDEKSSGPQVNEGEAFLSRTLYEQLVLVYDRVTATIGNERIDFEGAHLQDVEQDLQIRVEDGEGELFGDIPMRVLIEDASEDPDIAVTTKIDSGQISEILELRDKIIDRGLKVFYEGTQDDEFDQDLDTGLELIAVKGRAEGGAKDGKDKADEVKNPEDPTVDCEAARKSEAFGAMVAAACAVPAAAACTLGSPSDQLSAECIKSLSCEIGSIVSAFVAAEASYEGDCR